MHLCALKEEKFEGKAVSACTTAHSSQFGATHITQFIHTTKLQSFSKLNFFNLYNFVSLVVRAY